MYGAPVAGPSPMQAAERLTELVDGGAGQQWQPHPEHLGPQDPQGTPLEKRDRIDRGGAYGPQLVKDTVLAERDKETDTQTGIGGGIQQPVGRAGQKCERFLNSLKSYLETGKGQPGVIEA